MMIRGVGITMTYREDKRRNYYDFTVVVGFK